MGEGVGRRKGELTAAAIDRGWPHQVAVPATECRGSHGWFVEAFCLRPLGVRAAPQRLPRGQMVDRLLLRGCGACQEIPHEIWRRTIQSEGSRPGLELGAVVQGWTLSSYIAEMC